MTAIWSLDGYLAADSEAIEASGESPYHHACRFADEWDEPVELELDAGVWHVYPAAYADGTRPPAELMTAYPSEDFSHDD